MKKLLFGIAAVTALFTVSCSKSSDSALSENSWSVDQKKYEAVSVSVVHAADLITAIADNNSISIKFKELPTGSAAFTVTDGPYKANEVAIKCILSGNIVYNTISNNPSGVSVSVTDGKYTIVMANVKAVNADQPKDTVNISAYIVTP